jgi:hypothetical protein
MIFLVLYRVSLVTQFLAYKSQLTEIPMTIGIQSHFILGSNAVIFQARIQLLGIEFLGFQSIGILSVGIQSLGIQSQ